VLDSQDSLLDGDQCSLLRTDDTVAELHRMVMYQGENDFIE